MKQEFFLHSFGSYIKIDNCSFIGTLPTFTNLFYIEESSFTISDFEMKNRSILSFIQSSGSNVTFKICRFFLNQFLENSHFVFSFEGNADKYKSETILDRVYFSKNVFGGKGLEFFGEKISIVIINLSLWKNKGITILFHDISDGSSIFFGGLIYIFENNFSKKNLTFNIINFFFKMESAFRFKKLGILL